jgi:hypothetical protein
MKKARSAAKLGVPRPRKTGLMALNLTPSVGRRLNMFKDRFNMTEDLKIDEFEEEDEEQCLKSGYMKVMASSVLGKSKNRFFTLTKYELMEYKDEFKIELLAVFEVDDLHNVRVKETTVYLNHQTEGKEHKLKLKAPTKVAADDWMDAIIKATQHDIMTEMSGHGKLQQLLMGKSDKVADTISGSSSPAYCITHHKPKPASYWVCIRVQTGRGLMPMDYNGLSDPYIVVRYWDETNEKEKGVVVAKTKIKRKTLTPKWDTELGFFCAGPSLTIELWDWDLASEDDPMGEVAIDLRMDVQSVKKDLSWVQLEEPHKQLRRGGRKVKKHNARKASKHAPPGTYGQLQLSMQIHDLKRKAVLSVDPSSIESEEVRCNCPLARANNPLPTAGTVAIASHVLTLLLSLPPALPIVSCHPSSISVRSRSSLSLCVSVTPASWAISG